MEVFLEFIISTSQLYKETLTYVRGLFVPTGHSFHFSVSVCLIETLDLSIFVRFTGLLAGGIFGFEKKVIYSLQIGDRSLGSA